MEDISKIITQFHVHSHRQFLHAQSHNYNEARHKAFSCLFTRHFLAKTFFNFQHYSHETVALLSFSALQHHQYSVT